jgi:hypothetical protein
MHTVTSDRRAAPDPRRNRWLLAGIFAIAIVPLVVAQLLYHRFEGGAPWGTTNNGELLWPTVPVTTLALEPLARAPGSPVLPGARSDGSQLHGHWWLLLVAERDCAGACEEALHMLRQLHVLLNRDAHRVRRGVAFTAADPSAERWRDLANEYAPLAGFSVRDPGATRHGIYIVDPHGNLVLFYDYAAAGKPVLDDMKRLLKASQVG